MNCKLMIIQCNISTTCFCFLWCCGPMRAMASSFLRFLDHTQWRITVGRTPLDEWSARHRDLYLTTHNTNNRQTSMPLVGFEPMISASERPQNYALDRAATGTGNISTTTLSNCPDDQMLHSAHWPNILPVLTLVPHTDSRSSPSQSPSIRTAPVTCHFLSWINTVLSSETSRPM